MGTSSFEFGPGLSESTAACSSKTSQVLTDNCAPSKFIHCKCLFLPLTGSHCYYECVWTLWKGPYRDMKHFMYLSLDPVCVKSCSRRGLVLKSPLGEDHSIGSEHPQEHDQSPELSSVAAAPWLTLLWLLPLSLLIWFSGTYCQTLNNNNLCQSVAKTNAFNGCTLTVHNCP